MLSKRCMGALEVPRSTMRAMQGLERMLDANLNRAREGLRVLEDIARFGLADSDLTAKFKGLRHTLRDVSAGVPGGEARLVAWRDTPADPGTVVTASGEGERAGVGGIAVAAGKRVGEALRVIEECCKALGVEWGVVERARYTHYECERRLLAALGTGAVGAVGAGGGNMPPEGWRLCVLVTGSQCRRGWEEVIRESVRGGADCIQIREPGLDDRALAERAREGVRFVREEGVRAGRRVWTVINNRADVALLSGADGVHLGQSDLTVRDVRRLAGARLIVGVSTHSHEEAERAADDGADYCGVGAMFATGTKPRAVSGPEYLRWYTGSARVSRIPHLAIGGITPQRVGALVAAGCRGVAVSAAVCGAEDPAGVCREILERLGRV
jgi:thiamine-phosphate pyrophosphorylase